MEAAFGDMDDFSIARGSEVETGRGVKMGINEVADEEVGKSYGGGVEIGKLVSIATLDLDAALKGLTELSGLMFCMVT